MRAILRFSLSALFPLALLPFCGKGVEPDKTAGTVTETENALVSGMLYQKAGGPAKGARVHFIRAEYDPYTAGLNKTLLASDSVLTDSLGRYGTNNLSPGLYNIFGEDGQGHLSLVDSFRVTGDTQKVVGDTLKVPGNLNGIVGLKGAGDPRNVILVCFGTTRIALPTLSGAFGLARMAEGRYSVRFMTGGMTDYEPLDTSFQVAAESTIVLSDTIRLKFKGIPTPTGLSIHYDTLKQIVTLAWNRADTALTREYSVYRRDTAIGGALVKINSIPVNDTFFNDTTAIQDETYEYAVAAINKLGVEGTKSTLQSVTIHSAFKFIRQIGSAGIGYGQYQNPMSVTADSQGRILVADYDAGKIVVYDTAGSILKEITGFTAPVGVVSGPQRSLYVLEETTCLIKRIDSTGAATTSFGGRGTGQTQFGSQHLPWKPALSSGNQLFIPDMSSDKIKIFDLTGIFLRSIDIAKPVSLAFLNDNVLVAGNDAFPNYGIIFMDTLGTISNQWNGVNSNLQITPNNEIITFTYLNSGQIVYYSIQGTITAKFGKPGMFNCLRDVSTGLFNRLIIADSENKKVLLFSSPK